MIRVVGGELGGGKTYRAVTEMIAERRANRERIIATNVALTEKGRRLLGPALIILGDTDDYWGCEECWPEGTDEPVRREGLRNCKHAKGHAYSQVQKWWEFTPNGAACWIDEGVVKFDAHNWKRISEQNPKLATYLSHVRHLGDDCTLIIQKYKHLATRIRELAQEFVWCHSVKNSLVAMKMWVPFFPELFVQRTYLDDQFKDQLTSHTTICNRRVYELFDSWAENTSTGVRRRNITAAQLRAALADTGEVPAGEAVATAAAGRQGLYWWAAAAATAVGVGWGMA